MHEFGSRRDSNRFDDRVYYHLGDVKDFSRVVAAVGGVVRMC